MHLIYIILVIRKKKRNGKKGRKDDQTHKTLHRNNLTLSNTSHVKKGG